MLDESRQNFQPDPGDGLVFVAGDRDSGLIITGTGDSSLAFTVQGVPVEARLTASLLKPGVLAVKLNIAPEKPVRFKVEWLVPAVVLNAAMTLNGGLLISPFSDVYPDGGLPVPGAACGQANPLSTLCPGRFQSISFAWNPGDELIMYQVLDLV